MLHTPLWKRNYGDNFFLFQFSSFSTEELYDIVTVRDGLSGDAEVLASLSGSITPDILVSSTNYMVVQFKTDHSVHGAGFKATWRPGEYTCKIYNNFPSGKHVCEINTPLYPTFI